MSNIFLDSNICIYALSANNNNKQIVAFNLLQNTPNINAQVVIETYNACSRKLKLPHNICASIIQNLLAITTICSTNNETLNKGLFIHTKYGFSFLDSLIIAAALQNNCNILYTEDLHHNTVIENTLTIIHSFN